MSKIMLVEDDNNLREIYEARLRAEGYEIVAARDGEEALVVAKAEKPDLVIADVMMPKISGFEMLDILRNTDGLKDVKVIMLTALGQSDDQQRAQKLGADRYLVKSQVTLEDIVKAAHELLADATAAPASNAATPAIPTPPPAAPPAPTATTPSAPPTEPAKASSAAPEPAKAAPAAAPAVPPKPAVPAQSAPLTPAPTPASQAADPKPAPVPTPPAADSEATAPPATDTADSANDDKLMADAVNALVADTEKTTEKATTDTNADEATADTADTKKPPKISGQGKALAAKPSDEDEGSDDEDGSSPVKIANKKVIKPLETEPEKDLDTLLAEEEAKEAAQARGQAPPPTNKDIADAEAALANAASDKADEEAAVDAKIEDFVAGATTEADSPNTTGDKPTATPGNAASQPSAPETETASAPTATSAPPAAKPITITEDAPSGAPAASLSGNPGAPPATPATGPKTPPDPSSIAL